MRNVRFQLVRVGKCVYQVALMDRLQLSYVKQCYYYCLSMVKQISTVFTEEGKELNLISNSTNVWTVSLCSPSPALWLSD